MYIEKDIKVFSALIIILCIVFSASLTTNFLAFLNYLRGEISPLNAEAAPPFCHSSWEDKQMKGSTKQIP